MKVGEVYRLNNCEWCERCPPKPCWLMPNSLAIIAEIAPDRFKHRKPDVPIPRVKIKASSGCFATIDFSRLKAVSPLEALSWAAE